MISMPASSSGSRRTRCWLVVASREPLTYEVAWARAGRRALGRLPEKAALACVEFIYGALAENPQRVGRALRLEFTGLHSARRGDFRVIYRIVADRKTVEIVTIDHR